MAMDAASTEAILTAVTGKVKRRIEENIQTNHFVQMTCLADVAEVESPEEGVGAMLAASQRQSITRTGCSRLRG